MIEEVVGVLCLIYERSFLVGDLQHGFNFREGEEGDPVLQLRQSQRGGEEVRPAKDLPREVQAGGPKWRSSSLNRITSFVCPLTSFSKYDCRDFLKYRYL